MTGRTNPTCIYCGERAATTRDHVPPKGLIPPAARTALRTVASCSRCNAGASRDEEYFRLVLATLLGAEPADEVFIGPVCRSLDRRAHLEELVWESLEVDEAGLPFVTLQVPRLVNVVRKIVHGLYRLDVGRELAPESTVDAAFRSGTGWPAGIMDEFRRAHVNDALAPYFSYSFAPAPCPEIAGAWLLMFYEDFSCLARAKVVAEGRSSMT